MNELDVVIGEIKHEFGDFEIIEKKNSLFMKTINVLLRIITFNQMKTFMTGFTTTIGHKVYVSDSWDKRADKMKAATLRHEFVHMKQERRMGKVLYRLTYLFWIFPVFFAKGRRDLEMEAYTESMKAHFEYYGARYVSTPEYKKHVCKHFTSAQYFWMWWRSADIEKWFDETLNKIISN